jgi:hypothetical protein
LTHDQCRETNREKKTGRDKKTGREKKREEYREKNIAVKRRQL